MTGHDVAGVPCGTLAFFILGGGDVGSAPRTVTTVDPFETRAIAAARGGDADAYDFLVQAYSRRVLSIAIGLVRNRADAEDLAQEAFVKAFETLHRFREGKPFGPWIYRIVTNLALDLLKRKARRDESRNVDATDTIATRRDDADRALTTRELAGRIDEAIESLPPIQRAVARLLLVEEFSHGEVAEMIGLRESTVRSHLALARAKLREALGDMREP